MCRGGLRVVVGFVFGGWGVAEGARRELLGLAPRPTSLPPWEDARVPGRPWVGLPVADLVGERDRFFGVGPDDRERSTTTPPAQGQLTRPSFMAKPVASR